MHPDQEYASYLLDGIANGFRIGFSHATHTCTPAKKNHPSANEHPSVISEGLANEVQKGRLIGPLNPNDYPYAQISSLGAIPKKHSDKWRLILDLSHPAGSSVNDGISKSFCSLSYMKVQDVVRQILKLGRGCFLAKIDVDSAFRNVPVHPHDRPLLGMIWNQQLYIDSVLPFGLRSAPKIFNAVAAALRWIAVQRGVTYLDHFLDDFITAAATEHECLGNLTLLENTCHILNLPLSLPKREGPSTTLVFLGIELDTIALELRLPAQKLERLKSTIQKWYDKFFRNHKPFCKRKELESLIGLLQDASIVVRPGRTFLRYLINHLKSSHHRRGNVFIRLNKEAQSDIVWWHCFIEHWNGLSMMLDDRKDHPDVVLTSDASGSWGCGAFWDKLWFQFIWPEALRNLHITNKEILPIVLAVATWGAQWKNKSVLCRCDNAAAVHIINASTSSDSYAMALIRCLHFLTARFNIALSACHLPGTENAIADALSRNKLSHFFSLNPQANRYPCPIPAAVINLLTKPHLDWTSQAWREMFSTIFMPPSQKILNTPIPQHTADTSTSAPVQD